MQSEYFEQLNKQELLKLSQDYYNMARQYKMLADDSWSERERLKYNRMASLRLKQGQEYERRATK